MNDATTIARYSPAAQAFHWLSMLLIVAVWLLGAFSDEFPRGERREFAEFLHVSGGQIIVALLCARLVWRFLSPPPPSAPTALGAFGDKLGKIAHFAMYALIAAVTAAGLVTLFAGGDAAPLFGFGEIASPWPKDKAFEESMKEIHESLANALIVLATLHAAAALVHHFVLRDATLKRMLPGRSRAA